VSGVVVLSNPPLSCGLVNQRRRSRRLGGHSPTRYGTVVHSIEGKRVFRLWQLKSVTTVTPLTTGVTCQVDAARAMNLGFGMLLAEVGLPPGAEVDRDSLEAVLHDRRSGVYRYDVLPDRVVLYLWPPNDSSPFSFDFHTRFAMEAKSAPSSLFDYYNPEVSSEVAPRVFRIR
jgi:hypothetical protein